MTGRVFRHLVTLSPCHLVIFFFLLFFFRLNARDLWSSHEGRAAENGQMILSRGFWGLPRQCDFQPEWQKPPLYYWLVAGLGWLRGGVDAAAVRLPSAQAALGTVLALFLFGWLRGRPTVGLLAALTVASMVHFTWLARIGRIDMPLTFAMTVALLGFQLGYDNSLTATRSWPWYLASYVAVAAAILLKGPVGLILPAGVIGAFILIAQSKPTGGGSWASTHGLPPVGLGERRALWGAVRTLLWGVPLLLALVGPWFWWVGTRTQGNWYRTFFWYHNFDRALGSGSLRSHPWWFYGPRLFVDLLPWSILLPWVAVSAVRRGALRNDSEARFGLVWFAAIFVALSCAHFKRADYLLPAYPGAALFLACELDQWLRARPRWSRPALAGILAGYTLSWCVYVEYVLPMAESAREFRPFAAAIRARAPAPEVVIFFRVECHALGFHVGAPINTILEWENIDAWIAKPGTHYIVTSPECAADWPRYLTKGTLEFVTTNEELAGVRHEQPLVLMRTRSLPCSTPADLVPCPTEATSSEKTAPHVRAPGTSAD